MRRGISQITYEKVIKTMPKEIINALPETPDKLLKYATRVTQIQFASSIKEDVRNLMKQHLLSDEEYLKTFYYVMAITFYKKKAVENPKISVVVAQTGSGKSNLTAKLLREDENTIFVDSDKYKHFRYDARQIAKDYQVLYPFLTGPDGYDHANNIYEYAIDHKYNIIKETAPSSNKELLEMDINELEKKNYEIFIHVLSVGELNSLLSIHERYELQIIYGLKTAKLTGIARHDESYNSLIPKINQILNNNITNNIYIYSRGTNEQHFEPIKVYPSKQYNNPIKAIENTRKIDNDKTTIDFEQRYNLILEQMKQRNAPKEQYEQIEKIKQRM